MSAEWTGKFRIETAGLYTFWTESDDGSRVYVDGTMVVANGGFHPVTERSGNVTLSSGDHSIVVVFFQGIGDLSIVLSWQGPDSNDVRDVMPEGRFFTTTGSCPVSCGSHGEVASVPSEGHQWMFKGGSVSLASWAYNDGVPDGGGGKECCRNNDRFCVSLFCHQRSPLRFCCCSLFLMLRGPERRGVDLLPPHCSSNLTRSC